MQLHTSIADDDVGFVKFFSDRSAAQFNDFLQVVEFLRLVEAFLAQEDQSTFSECWVLEVR